MTPVPIMHLITELSTGGAQMALLRLLERLDRQRFDPQVVCLYNGSASVAQQIRRLGVPVTDLEMKSKWRLDAIWRLYRLLRQVHPVLLHTWLFHANLPGRVVGRLAGVPFILSAERTMEMEGPVRRWLNRLTAPFADRILCVSNHVAEFAAKQIGLPRRKLVVIPNGLDIEMYQSLPEKEQARLRLGVPGEGLLVGSAGRLQKVKGFPILLNAFAGLVKTIPNARLIIAGSGPDLESLQALTNQLGVNGRVHFLGHQEEMPLVLAACDLFALASHHEGLPNALLEAMAAGLPVVATAVGGTPELVVDGETGFLVPPGNPQSLAEAMAKLGRDPVLRSRLGQNGLRRVRNEYNLAETVKKTEQVYTELLNQKVRK